MNGPLNASAEVLYEVVWPSGKLVTQPVDLAPAVLDLNGKTVGEIWDWVFKGDQMYSVLNDELRKAYPDIKFVDYKTMGDSHATNEREYVANLHNLLRQHGCDAVISSVGA